MGRLQRVVRRDSHQVPPRRVTGPPRDTRASNRSRARRPRRVRQNSLRSGERSAVSRGRHDGPVRGERSGDDWSEEPGGNRHVGAGAPRRSVPRRQAERPDTTPGCGPVPQRPRLGRRFEPWPSSPSFSDLDALTAARQRMPDDPRIVGGPCPAVERRCGIGGAVPPVVGTPMREGTRPSPTAGARQDPPIEGRRVPTETSA